MLDIACETKEQADALRFHMRRSAQAQELEQEVEQSQTDRATVEFLRHQPLEGLTLLGQVDPAATREFALQWIRENPGAALQVVEEYQEMTDRERSLAAEKAARDNRDRAQRALRAHDVTTVEQQYSRRAGEAIAQLADQLRLDGEDKQEFVRAAAAELEAEFRQKPAMRAHEMVFRLQRVVQRFAPTAVTPAPGPRPRMPPPRRRRPRASRRNG